ncbi:methylthioribose-1-phosphate isomerase [Streptomyces umbrinus]|uniref:Methylthioribose-1-phosphate isomerase n=1 Tax=Streptomyces umbrinus TaxID=67370 RepID=A0ABU0T1B2_9ACTN|nr:S-methyl-5-thioribose-1-phosphate isomerase [Streptomyces umbrinus]MDQ1029487.1 methylthioribose-1-phosphate isomerase [Streptomyces umbrinus]
MTSAESGRALSAGIGPVIGWSGDVIVALDQTALPRQTNLVRLTTVDQLVEAIRRLVVRGAPVLGAAGALGVALAVREADRSSWTPSELTYQVDRIRDARPTAADLAVGVSVVRPLIPQGAKVVEAAARSYVDRIVGSNRRLATRGADYLADLFPGKVLRLHTHCNTGALAGVEWGTALGVVQALHARKLVSQVIVDETRPLLQGARLTCWELERLGIDHRLICDGAGPYVLARGDVDAVVVGADRIAANGDVANKIGTYALALGARHAGVPFVVAAPESTLDVTIPDGSAIAVEQRAEAEVTQVQGILLAPESTRALNYAFDITPAEFVSAVVTDRRLIVVPSGPGAIAKQRTA